MKWLLDVNVLLAAIWIDHVRHPEVFRWLHQKRLVVCPLSELGFLRISSNKRAFNATMERSRELLDTFITDRSAERIFDDLSPFESHPRNSDAVTDHYLADLAAKHGLKLATLDEGINHSNVEIIV